MAVCGTMAVCGLFAGCPASRSAVPTEKMENSMCCRSRLPERGFGSKEKRQEIFELNKPAGARWKKGSLEDTIYSEEPDVVDEWGEFYLPEIVSMKVEGVVEGTSCPSDQLVLMTCEDGKLYAYDGEELHLVASSMEQLLEEGIEYPGSKTYYEGEAFKDKTEEDWEEVWNRPTGMKLEQEHLKLVTENKDRFMECFEPQLQ